MQCFAAAACLSLPRLKPAAQVLNLVRTTYAIPNALACATLRTALITMLLVSVCNAEVATILRTTRATLNASVFVNRIQLKLNQSPTALNTTTMVTALNAEVAST